MVCQEKVPVSHSERNKSLVRKGCPFEKSIMKKIDKLCKEIEREEAESKIKEFRDNLIKKEKNDFEKDRKIFEDQFMLEIKKEIEEDGSEKLRNKIGYKIISFIYKIGILSFVMIFSAKIDYFFGLIQHKLGLYQEDEAENQKIRHIIFFAILIFVLLVILIIKKTIIYLIKQ